MKNKEHEREAADIGTAAMAGGEKGKDKPKKKGKVIGMNIRRAKNKGYTAHHVHEHPEMPGHEQIDAVPHILDNQAELHAHQDEHMPEMAEGGEAGGAPESGAPGE